MTESISKFCFAIREENTRIEGWLANRVFRQLIACVGMVVFSRTPFVRLANAVRDNPVRAAAIGVDPPRGRLG